jgi:hypothetical protein
LGLEFGLNSLRRSRIPASASLVSDPRGSEMVRKRSPPLRPSQVPLAPDTARRRPKQVKLRRLSSLLPPPSSLLSRLPQPIGLLPQSSSPVPAVSISVLSAGLTLGLSVQWQLVGRAAATGGKWSGGELFEALMALPDKFKKSYLSSLP